MGRANERASINCRAVVRRRDRRAAEPSTGMETQGCPARCGHCPRQHVVVAGLVWLVGRTEGWQDVRRSFFSPEHFREAFPKVLDGFKLNVKIFLVAEPIILAVGLLLAVVRNTRSPVLFPARAVAVAYVDLFRERHRCSSFSRWGLAFLRSASPECRIRPSSGVRSPSF